MPIPLYAPPPMRSSRSPNPFDRAQAPRLRILVDAPLVTGPVDGAGDYHGYPFLGGGSTGYPDAATVLRSYFSHPGLEIYRIVQEALTNVVKHAGPGARARVAVDLGEPGRRRAVRIEVSDDGAAATGGPGLPSSGRGLAGMRERVRMFGGTLTVAPGPDGGFRVVATLPLQPVATAVSQRDIGSMHACPDSRPLGS